MAFKIYLLYLRQIILKAINLRYYLSETLKNLLKAIIIIL